jgi:hypothetical protein
MCRDCNDREATDSRPAGDGGPYGKPWCEPVVGLGEVSDEATTERMVRDQLRLRSPPGGPLCSSLTFDRSGTLFLRSGPRFRACRNPDADRNQAVGAEFPDFGYAVR